jgi:hypothetical protein
MLVRTRLVTAAFAFVFLAPSAIAQCTPAWEPDGYHGLNGTAVTSVLWDPDGAGPLGQVYVVAGTFSVAGNTSVGGIATYDPATQTWASVSGLNGISALAASPQGGLFAVVGQMVYRLTTSGWTQLGSGMNGNVNGITALPNGDLFAAGAFTNAGGTTVNGFARWNGTTWLNAGPGVIAQGLAVATMPNGGVLAAGRFTIGGVTSDYVARWDTFFWTILGPAFNANVRTVFAVGNSDFVVGGDFTSAGATAATRIARWNGSAWSAMGSGLDAAPIAITAIAGEIVVGGSFTQAGGNAAAYIAKWNGSAWSTYREGMNTAVRGLTVMPGGQLFACGDFTYASRVTVNYVTKWDGSKWQAVGSGRHRLPVTNVRAIVPLANGEIYIGGSFAQGTGLNYVAHYDLQSWQPLGEGLNASVHALVRMPNGDLIAGGDFTQTYNGTTALPYVARWNGTSWQPMGSLNGSVRALAVSPSGQLFAGGQFSSPSYIATWDGTAWVGVGSGASNQVRALTFESNGNLLAGGQSTIGGVGSYIGRWDGTTWSALGSGPGYPVSSIAVSPTGEIAVGSWYPWSYTTTPVYRWVQGTWQYAFHQGNGYNDTSAIALVSLPNGDLVAGSEGYYNWPLTRWNALGTYQPFANGVNSSVSSLAVLGNNTLYVGGYFSYAGSVQSNGIAKFTSPCPATATPAGAGCNGSAGPVQLTFTPAPWVGLTCQSRTTGLATYAFAIVLYGFSPTNLPLPAVHPLGSAGCGLYTSPDVIDVQVPFGGEVYSQLFIPNNTALLGAVLYHQTLQYETDNAFNGLALNSSNAMRLQLGTF